MIAVVAGSVAQRPGRGGHTWVFLQYLLGLRELGWNVLLLDRLEAGMSVDEQGRPCDPESSVNVAYMREVMSGFGLEDSYSILLEGGESIGVTRAEAVERLAASALLLNVNGFLTDPELLSRASKRVFLDIDPGFWQMWRELGLHDAFGGHDAYVSVAESIGRPGCAIPTCGLDWIPTPQPVVLDEWPATVGGSGRFTSVGSWRGPFAPIEYGGVTYGLRVHELRRFAELPKRSSEEFELALDIDAADAADLELLRANRWSLVDPAVAARDPWSYRSYVQGSKAELMVAKNMYVRARSGWFSDRSICYLASGRPVLAQETGFSEHHPTGRGLLAYETLEEARAGASAIAADYDLHAHAARALAEDRFGSEGVLTRLLERLEVSS